MRATLNLASRPVRNERLPAVLFGIAAFALLLVTLQHATIIYRLLPARSKALRDEVAALQAERAALAREASTLTRVTSSREQQTEWAILKSLVDERTFWWSQLFAVLEEVLPNESRILNVAPKATRGEYTVEMNVRVQSHNVGYAFARALEQRPEFWDVSVRSITGARAGEAEFQFTMRYLKLGRADAPAAPPAKATATATATPAAGDQEARLAPQEEAR